MSVLAIGFAALLAMLARQQTGSDGTIAAIIAATFAVSGLVSLVGSRGRHFSWLLLFAIAVLAWLGSR